ncbi:Rubredoxin-type Fe(Cys)4 protein [Alkaliphilus metalliredigens QYMF]|uniref:Rubredoxin-type Fe(Cys)4 protein n=1 Tax=Alkaliphilus metalliredigens (strain QYMF) TaxID=293826 RepID=A6TML4_ALKMQ|nr:rubredoxin [Alkaliphilus metalliredigens]ABR47432.1 Rubredoxin-type Fe(Cys)4 protein [Alkaliphilus metalliredigens QYMF]
MRLYKCQVCNYVHDEEAPEKCPKCGAPREKFNDLSEEQITLVERSVYSNSLHMELYTLLQQMSEIADAGIEDDLDPGCVAIFKKTEIFSELMKRMIQAELEIHMKKGKWGKG